jgi:hypothetical protein
MRTKTLLLAAALSAAGLATSLAQSNVYSLNVVGYINATLPTNGTYLLTAPLDLDGTGLNNTLDTVLGTNYTTTLPNNPHVYGWTGSSWGYNVQLLSTGWSGPTSAVNTNSMRPGQAFFFQNKSGSPVTITMVGNVLQKCFSLPLVTGVNAVGSPVPQEGKVETDLQFSIPSNTGTSASHVYRNVNGFSGATGVGYANFLKSGTTWVPSEPILKVGEGFIINSPVGTPAFTRCFTVQ